MDADFGLANIEIMFGTIPKYNLSDLIYQEKTSKRSLPGDRERWVLSRGKRYRGTFQSEKEYLAYIVQNLAKLDAIADIIIIDTAAGISDAVLEFLVASGEILVVTTPEPTSITDSYSLLKELNRHPRYVPENTRIKVITNRIETREEGKTLFNKLNAVVSGI